METHELMEEIARTSYARLLAYLGARYRDLAAAEDALSEAFLAGLQSWPRDGIPLRPEAWLLSVARRRLVDKIRHELVEEAAIPDLAHTMDTMDTRDTFEPFPDDEFEFPDERLKLLFVCAHPAIDPSVRTPLMLQCVLRLDAVRIASAFVVKPATMGQRLSRAKTKIRDARIRFEVPNGEELPARLGFVLEAVYAAFGTGWEDIAGANGTRASLAEEAIELGRLLAGLLPQEPEVLGLLALMLHAHARRHARRSASGAYLPLSGQDTARWDDLMINQANQWLLRAANFHRMGPFQLEAAIQSVHNDRAVSGVTHWDAIALLYEGLVRMAPRLGALVSRCAALAESRNSAFALAELDLLPPDLIRDYQPYWALRAHLLAGLNRTNEARAAYSRAIGLCEDVAMRDYLVARDRALPPNADLTRGPSTIAEP